MSQDRNGVTRVFAVLIISALSTAFAIGSAAPAASKPKPITDGVEASGNRVKATYRGEIFIAGDELVNNASRSGSNHRSGGGGGGCGDCTWELIYACANNHPGGEGNDTLCMGATVGCEPGVFRFRIYMTDPPAPPDLIVTRCVGDRTVVEGRRVVEEAQKAFRDLVPNAAPPTISQRGAPLIHLATYLKADGDSAKTIQVNLDGFTLDVNATAEYNWNFGDGQTLHTNVAGRGYTAGDDPGNPPGAPDAVMHWYRNTGFFQAALQTTWRGSYVFQGATTTMQPIAFPAVALQVTVYESRVTLYN